MKRKFYDGIVFHRVIPGFMAQTGDPTGTGTGGSDLPNIPAEFSTKAHFMRGTVGMARSQRPEFGQFAVLHLLRRRGLPRRQVHRVRRSRLGHGDDRRDQGRTQANNGQVDDPDKIISMRLAPDAQVSFRYQEYESIMSAPATP